MEEGLLCFGGSFNPIHEAHLRCCRKVANDRHLHRVLLVPSAHPPHKMRQDDMASATDRLTMCHLAVADDPLFEVSGIELKRQSPSYTYDTVRELKAAGHQDVSWLIGADMLMTLPMWHRPVELIHEATILVMARPGVKIRWTALPAEFQSLQSNLVSAPLIDISATDIRRRLKAGEPVSHLIPAGVERYIRERGLYGVSKQPADSG